MAATKFSSDGFDLSELPGEDDVIYELGGGVTKIELQPKEEPSDNAKAQQSTTTTTPSPIDASEELKAQGNAIFKDGNYLEAYGMYSEAIQKCPGIAGKELMEKKAAFEEEERRGAMERHRKYDNERRKALSENQPEPEKPKDGPMKEFQAPVHTYGDKLAIYHNNRAACLLHLGRTDEALEDCEIATTLNPTYSKAWMRLSTCHEKLERTEEALKDAKMASELDPKNVTIQRTVKRLQKVEDERLEKLKEETMGKLKDLGNSILGNFGLSLDNFNAVQDPNTGSYSISFNQGGNNHQTNV